MKNKNLIGNTEEGFKAEVFAVQKEVTIDNKSLMVGDWVKDPIDNNIVWQWEPCDYEDIEVDVLPQQVLVRDGLKNEWMCDLYSHYDNETEYHFCVGGRYECCIPYEGNEALLGTTDAPHPERWRAGEDERYWYVCSYGSIDIATDTRMCTDDCRYAIGNYFQTKEQAEETAVKFKQMLKGE